MLRPMLRAKIHRAVLTRTDLNYRGSITLPGDLMKTAGMAPGEMVQVVNIMNGARAFTYTIEGTEPGDVCLNGAAARLGERGDLLIVMALGMASDEELAGWRTRMVEMNPDNTVASVAEE
jgi:aspartate 1-decarboxylase